MANIDDELLQDELDDAKCIEFIQNKLPVEVKEKFSEDELYFFLDCIYEYYATSGILDAKPDNDGCVSINLSLVAEYTKEKAAKAGIGDFDVDDIMLVVEAEMEYGEQE